MKRFDRVLVNLTSALLGFLIAFSCFEASFIALGHLIDGDNFGSPGYTDYGLGFIAIIVGLPMLAILTFVFTRHFRNRIGNLVIKIRKRKHATGS